MIALFYRGPPTSTAGAFLSTLSSMSKPTTRPWRPILTFGSMALSRRPSPLQEIAVDGFAPFLVALPRRFGQDAVSAALIVPNRRLFGIEGGGEINRLQCPPQTRVFLREKYLGTSYGSPVQRFRSPNPNSHFRGWADGMERASLSSRLKTHGQAAPLARFEAMSMRRPGLTR